MLNNYSIVVDIGELRSPMPIGVHKRYHIGHIIRSHSSGSFRWVIGIWYEVIRIRWEPDQFTEIVNAINKSYPSIIVKKYLGWEVEESQL